MLKSCNADSRYLLVAFLIVIFSFANYSYAAVFRPSTGIWYLLRSTSGFVALQFGVPTDVPKENAFVP